MESQASSVPVVAKELVSLSTPLLIFVSIGSTVFTWPLYCNIFTLQNSAATNKSNAPLPPPPKPAPKPAASSISAMMSKVPLVPSNVTWSLTHLQSTAEKKAAAAPAPAASKTDEHKSKPHVASPPAAPAAVASAKPSPKKAAAASPIPAPAPAPVAPVSAHKVLTADGSDDSDDGVAPAVAAPLARKRRVVDSDSEDDQRPRVQSGPVQTEDGEEVNFSPQKDVVASKLGKKARERPSPSKPAPAPARPISFSNAVTIAAAPAAKKKKVARV